MGKKSCAGSICCNLDSNSGSGINNWRKLLELLNDKGILNGNEAFLYESNYYGGGSPTKAMFDAIRSKFPTASLQDLIKKLKEIHRYDVASHLQEIVEKRGVKLLKDLNLKERVYFKKLDIQTRNNWENLAEKYGFNLKEQKSFKGEEVKPNNWSPSKAVLEDAIATSPKFLLKDFLDILKKMDRNDLINDIIGELKPEQPRNHQHQQHQQQLADPIQDAVSITEMIENVKLN